MNISILNKKCIVGWGSFPRLNLNIMSTMCIELVFKSSVCQVVLIMVPYEHHMENTS